jgi:hypothetical protein
VIASRDIMGKMMDILMNGLLLGTVKKYIRVCDFEPEDHPQHWDFLVRSNTSRSAKG